MSIALPSNKAEKKARYNMLVKQGSMTTQQAKQAYRDYLTMFNYVSNTTYSTWSRSNLGAKQ